MHNDAYNFFLFSVFFLFLSLSLSFARSHTKRNLDRRLIKNMYNTFTSTFNNLQITEDSHHIIPHALFSPSLSFVIPSFPFTVFHWCSFFHFPQFDAWPIVFFFFSNYYRVFFIPVFHFFFALTIHIFVDCLDVGNECNSIKMIHSARRNEESHVFVLWLPRTIFYSRETINVTWSTYCVVFCCWFLRHSRSPVSTMNPLVIHSSPSLYTFFFSILFTSLEQYFHHRRYHCQLYQLLFLHPCRPLAPRVLDLQLFVSHFSPVT